MEEIFQKIIDNRFSDLKGLTAYASVPMPEHMINEIVEVALQGNKNIQSCQVSIGAENRISAKLKTTLWPWPLNLKMRLFKSVDFISSPKIRARLENHLLLGKIGSFFKALPEGVKLYGDQVVVDIKSFVPAEEQRKFLDLIKSVEISTEEGKAIFDVKISVDE